MAGETQITLVGNVVDEVQLRFTPSGAPVCNFRMASTPRTFDKNTSAWVDGEPLFLGVSVWRQQAENLAESLEKGMRVVVVGALKARSYEKDGQKRTVFEIEAEDVAVSLKFATAKVSRANRQRDGGQQQGGNWNGNQQGGQRGGQQRSDDPWASSGGGGWGAPAGGSEPPF
jgi:single-strand DNA-binding protein